MTNDIADKGLDSLDYRRALGGFGTGVALVAAHDPDGRAHGLIINSLTSVSLAPPVVLWCLGDTCAAFRVFTAAPCFSLNILGSDAEAVARQYSRRGDRIIPPEDVITMTTGAPVLAAAVMSLDCSLRSRQAVGDHEVIFGDVAAFRTRTDADALGFFRGRFVTLSAEERD